MIIHGKGPKAARDRAMLTKMYSDLIAVFGGRRLKTHQLAAMDNWVLHRFCRDLYNQKSDKDIRWFNQVTGRSILTKEFRWRLFWWNFFHPIPFAKRSKSTRKPELMQQPEPSKGTPFVNA